MKKVIVAFPGREYSGDFLMVWSETLLALTKEGYQIALVNQYSSFVPFARMKTLGLDVLRGKDQKPFDGKLDYDVWLTIDSDVIFTPKQVMEIIEDTDKHPVVSGMYRLGTTQYSPVQEWNTEYFKKNGYFEFMSKDSIDPNKKYISVAYNGMGLFACTKEVLESLKYPYFHHPPIELDLEDGNSVTEMVSEDVAFCRNIKEAGYDITVNTNIVVGHEKKLIL
jgi:hypothetical protein|uniref:Glycosyltransferase n=1 Tax=viral metagenome TaxID=1070528 RepID=A0A6C0CNN5_9ZZZZ|tara:strand:- start:7726 stop:8394 length:669 start_codon:yes stop_codon:yes gene_type:complete